MTEKELGKRVIKNLSTHFLLETVHSVNLRDYDWDKWEKKHYHPSQNLQTINNALTFLDNTLNDDQLKICKQFIPLRMITTREIEIAVSFQKSGALYFASATPVTSFIQCCCAKGLFSHETIETLTKYL